MITRASTVEYATHSEAPGNDVDNLITDPEYSLWPAQRGALRAIMDAPAPRGALLPLAVGGGKFLVSILAASCVPGVERPVLLVPAKLYHQTMQELEIWRERAKVHPNLKIIKYSMLSLLSHAHELDEAAPDMLICDEAHYLRNLKARTTRVVARYLQEHPDTRVIMLSGTITSTSVGDFAHLSAACLRENSPVPSLHGHVKAWDSVIAPDASPEMALYNEFDTLLARRGLSGAQTKESITEAFWCHVYDTRGVHAHSEASCDAVLHIRRLNYTLPSDVLEHLKTLKDLWTLPNGREVDNPAEIAMQRSALFQGFFFEELWGGNVQPNEEFLSARRAWYKYVRDQIDRRHIDTEQDIHARGLSKRESVLYNSFINAPGPRPVRNPVFVNDFILDHLGDQLNAYGDACLVWIDNRAVQLALKERVPDRVIMAHEQLPVTDGSVSLALSMRGFGTGFNLQAWHQNVVVSMPSNASALEQLLGRTHRGGQLSKEVTYHMMTPEKFNWVLTQRAEQIKLQGSYQDINNHSRVMTARWEF